ncbi:LysR substrate-binding domain-containing protein, partial [Bacillus sp. EKM417B]
SLGMSMVPDVISSFQHMYPHVNFQLTQASNQQIIEQLTSREVDIALTSLRDENDEVICQPLLTEELYLAVSAEHPLASYDEIDLKMAEHEPFISFKDTNVLHGMIKELCEKA